MEKRLPRRISGWVWKVRITLDHNVSSEYFEMSGSSARQNKRICVRLEIKKKSQMMKLVTRCRTLTVFSASFDFVTSPSLFRSLLRVKIINGRKNEERARDSGAKCRSTTGMIYTRPICNFNVPMTTTTTTRLGEFPWHTATSRRLSTLSLPRALSFSLSFSLLTREHNFNCTRITTLNLRLKRTQLWIKLQDVSWEKKILQSK